MNEQTVQAVPGAGTFRGAAQQIDPQIPLVVVCNYVELFSGFLDQLGDPAVARARQYADHDLYWLGDRKLIITATPMNEMLPLLHHYGYAQTRVFTPRDISSQLCIDILRDPQALEVIREYAGPGRTLQLVAYANTPEFFQLVEGLTQTCGLSVRLPECGAPENLWVRDTIDTKIGFRTLACQWLAGAASLPEGHISGSLEEAAQITGWFLRQGRSCVVKYNQGGGGVGNCFFYAEEGLSPADVRSRLARHHGLFNLPAVVEAYIQPHRQLSPSIEVFVPAAGIGAPRLNYGCNQVFEDTGVFSGILINQDLYATAWYQQLAEAGLCIGAHLQQMGYIGFFDLDAVLDPEENLYLLEINSRRNGGTFVDEFARWRIGEDYQERVVLFSSTSIPFSGSVQDLLDRLDDLLFPIEGRATSGVVITAVSTLPEGKFGALLVAPTGEELACLWSAMQKRISAQEVSQAMLADLAGCPQG